MSGECNVCGVFGCVESNHCAFRVQHEVDTAVLRLKAAAFDAIASDDVTLYLESPGMPYVVFFGGRSRSVFPEHLLEAITEMIQGKPTD